MILGFATGLAVSLLLGLGFLYWLGSFDGGR